MGARGPVPKRSDEVAGHHRTTSSITKLPAKGAVDQPELMIPDAHPFIVEFWKSLGESAQSQFYEPSDWSYARWVLHFADGQIKNSRPSAQMVQALNSSFSDLLVSEGSRRRVQLEIERDQSKAEVVDLAAMFRERMGL